MVIIYVEGPRGGRLPLREENMIVDYVDTACQELEIKKIQKIPKKFKRIQKTPKKSRNS